MKHDKIDNLQKTLSLCSKPYIIANTWIRDRVAFAVSSKTHKVFAISLVAGFSVVYLTTIVTRKFGVESLNFIGTVAGTMVTVAGAIYATDRIRKQDDDKDKDALTLGLSSLKSSTNLVLSNIEQEDMQALRASYSLRIIARNLLYYLELLELIRINGGPRNYKSLIATFPLKRYHEIRYKEVSRIVAELVSKDEAVTYEEKLIFSSILKNICIQMNVEIEKALLELR